MVIQHNITAMNSNRQLGITTGLQRKSSEKLSAGYKINRAADDAAGLAISEKMRRQVRGLTQASKNIQDGISLVQIADGALAESMDNMQRVNELAVKAANDTLTDSDRSYIQEEVTQLLKEVDRTALTTTFNDSIYPLNGNPISIKYPDEVQNVSITVNNNGPSTITYGGITYNPGDSFIVDNVLGLKRGGSTYYAAIGYRVSNGGGTYYATSDVYNISPHSPDFYIVKSTMSDIRVDEYDRLYVDSLTFGENEVRYLGSLGIVSIEHMEYWGWDLNTIFKANKAGEETGPLLIQAGSESGHVIEINLVNATADGLGIVPNPLDVSTSNAARSSIDTVKSALQKISEYRSDFGAKQNQLEHAYNNVRNVVENTQHAESLIRDTDMATEMVKYSNNNILLQAGQSMLAQANQTNQGVLSLLQ